MEKNNSYTQSLTEKLILFIKLADQQIEEWITHFIDQIEDVYQN